MLLVQARMNSPGVAMRSPVRRATVTEKCLVLCVRSQSGRLVSAVITILLGDRELSLFA